MQKQILAIIAIILLILAALSVSLVLLLKTAPFSVAQTAELPGIPTAEQASAATGDEPKPAQTTSAAADEAEQPAAVNTPDPASATQTTSIPAQSAEEQPAQPGGAVEAAAPLACSIDSAFRAVLILEDSGTYEAPFGAEMIRVLTAKNARRIDLAALSGYLSVTAAGLAADYGIQSSTLGGIYHTVYQRISDPTERHARAASATNAVIAENFPIAADDYIVINQPFIQQLISFSGPLEVDNPTAFSSPRYSFPAGVLTLTADNIWDYMAYTSGTSTEHQRLQRQDLVLQTIFSALQNQAAPDEFGDWLDANLYLLHTNLETDQLFDAFCVLAFSAQNEYRQIPADNQDVQADRIFIPDPDRLSSLFE
jgi:hypothetical protein